MGAELPVFRILHPKPCVLKTYAILACVLRAHGFTCKIRNNVSSASILRRQSSILSCNRGAYHLLVWNHKKIDTKPIFTVPDMRPNLALISGTVKTNVASTLLWPNTPWCNCKWLVGLILSRPCNYGAKIARKLFFGQKPVRKHLYLVWDFAWVDKVV